MHKEYTLTRFQKLKLEWLKFRGDELEIVLFWKRIADKQNFFFTTVRMESGRKFIAMSKEWESTARAGLDYIERPVDIDLSKPHTLERGRRKMGK